MAGDKNMSNPIKRRRDMEHLKEILVHFLGSKHFSFKVLVYVFLLFIAAAWLPQVLAAGLEELIRLLPFQSFIWNRAWLWKILICALILVFFIFLARKIGKQKSHITVQSDHFCRGRVLVIFLSALNVMSKGHGNGDIPQTIRHMTAAMKGKPATEEERARLLAYIQATNWKMPLLAIRHHQRTLKEVYAITSAGEKSSKNRKQPGSHREFNLFKEVFEIVFERKGFIKELTRGGIDFEDAQAAFDTINRFYERQIKKGIKKEHIVVDVTGGKKISSIGGALATLSLGRKFQYVSTTDETVKAYDIGYTPPEE